MSKFKYFSNPEQFAWLHDGDVECDICHKKKLCFDAGTFYGIGEFNAFCFDCVAEGRLRDVESFGVDPDVQALKSQLAKLNPDWTPEMIEEKSEELTNKLLSTTPKIPSWQDWFWPAHCGDYCQFDRIAGQADLNQLALDGNGKELLRNALYYDLVDSTDIDEVWESLKPGRIKGVTDPNDNWGTLAYIFKCSKCGELVIIWDCN